MLDREVQLCLTPCMGTNRPTTALKRVTRATTRRDETCARSFEQYLEAIRAAREAGHTLQEIADAAGLSTRSSVAYLLNPDPRKEQT